METKRLYLRRYQSGDLDDFYAYISDEQVVEFEPYLPMNWEQACAELKRRVGNDEFIAVVLKEQQTLIGNIYLGRREFDTLELGYVFHRAYWRQGYAQEACEAAIEHAFHKGAHRICAHCDPLNIPSWHLLEKLGFEREAHLRKNVYFWTNDAGKPAWKDTFIYAKLRPEQ